MKEGDREKYSFIKNKKFIYIVIVIITLYLYNKVRNFEENIENFTENKIFKDQIENDIHLNNSKLLNIKIDKESIEQLILSEKEKNDKLNVDDDEKVELWKIETFFVTLFAVIYGGLYYYSYQKEKGNNNNKAEEKTYLFDNDYTNYILDEAEFEFLINKEGKFDDTNI